MVILVRASLNDATTIHEMQIESFKPLLKKYQDYDTNPATESIDDIVYRLKLDNVDYFLIQYDEHIVGSIRIIHLGDNKYRVGQIFVLPTYQGKGIAQNVFRIIESKYTHATTWELDTILEEKGNCYLYEKLGYKRTKRIESINDRMTIVHYYKEAN